MADKLVGAVTARTASPTGAGVGDRRADGRSGPHWDPGRVPDGVGVEIKLVMTDRALLGGGEEPAHLEGYGPVPAPWVRDLLHRGDTSARV